MFKITRLDNFEEDNNLHGYCVESTANINVEDSDIQSNQTVIKLTNKWFSGLTHFMHRKPASQSTTNQENNQQDIRIDELAKHLVKDDNPQLVINIHGYSTDINAAKQRNNNIYKYAVDNQLCPQKSLFIGYRWPSENISNNICSIISSLQESLTALPNLPLGILITTLAFLFIPVSLIFGKWTLLWAIISFSLSFLVWYGAKAHGALPIFPNGIFLVLFSSALFFALQYPLAEVKLWLLMALFFVLVSLCSVIAALILLRLSNYPRDRFRAFNYGVMDLVEFIRQLELSIQEIQDKFEDFPEDFKIHLSFIAHSLGCEVVTQTIRILANVFDQNQEDPYINKFFKLERLVLVAPDIPVESILSGRANFLQYSLRRINESYIFSNEADLALRLASTVANYFSFPSKSRFRGYKLGNITAKHFLDKFDQVYENNKWKQYSEKLKDYGIINLKEQQLEKLQDYGIINLQKEYNCSFNVEEPINHLEIRASDIEYKSLRELAGKQSVSDEELVVNTFTYLDCTDYVEDGKGVVSYALRKPALNMFDYFRLWLAKIDGHGDYFKGEFSQKMIYELAFSGFKIFLCESDEESLNQALTKFDKKCQDHQIQAILSSKIYKNYLSTSNGN